MATFGGWLSVTPTSGSGNGQLTNSSTTYTGRVVRSTSIRVANTTAGVYADYSASQTALGEFVTINSVTSIPSAGASGFTVQGTSNSAKLNFTFTISISWGSIPSTYTVTPTGGTAIVVNNNTAITGDPGATAQYSWSIDLYFNENTAIQSRSVVLSVAGTTASKTTTLTQLGAIGNISVSPTTLSFESTSALSKSVVVSSNTQWSATSNVSWITVSPASDSATTVRNTTVGVTVLDHTGTASRVGTITFLTDNGKVATVTVTQSAYPSTIISWELTEQGESLQLDKGGATDVLVYGWSNSTKLNFAIGSEPEIPDFAIGSSYWVQNGATYDQYAFNGVITGNPGATAQYRFYIKVSCSANYTIYSLVSNIIATASDGKPAIQRVVQMAGDAYLRLSDAATGGNPLTSITIPQTGTPSVPVYVQSNVTWDVTSI